MTHHGFLRVAAAVARLARRRLRFQRRAHPRPHGPRRERGRRRAGLPRTVDDRLHLRRPVPADRACNAAPSPPWTALSRRAPMPSRGLAVVGLPLAVDDQLFNCAAVLHRGRVLGVVPKSFIPNYKEFYEGRWFAAAATARSRRDRPGRRNAFPSAPTCSSTRPTSKGWSSASRSARTCGCRCRPARSRRCAGRRCWSTCRPATRSSARPTIAGSWSSTSPAAAWPPMSMPPAASGNRPPTWSSAATA